MNVVIDIQGFMTPEFTPKELAIWDGISVAPVHYLFKPPFPFQHLCQHLKKQAIWLEKNHHGLKWSQGFVDLKDINKILQLATENAEAVYCKGEIKVKYLKNLINKPVYDLDYLPSIRKIFKTESCINHALPKCVCALNIVKKIYPYIHNFSINDAYDYDDVLP